MLTIFNGFLAHLPDWLRRRPRAVGVIVEGRSVPRYWSTPRVLPFVSLEGDGTGNSDLACLLEGWQSPLRVHPDNPRYHELREILVSVRYGESIRAKIDLERSELVWAERTSEAPEVPIMDVYIRNADGEARLFVPSPEVRLRPSA